MMVMEGYGISLTPPPPPPNEINFTNSAFIFIILKSLVRSCDYIVLGEAL